MTSGHGADNRGEAAREALPPAGFADPVRGEAPAPLSFHDHRLDGLSALEALVQGLPYRTLIQAIASLTVFSSPEVVRQTECRAVIRVIRNAPRRGEIIEMDGRRVGLDDNKAPTDVFMWCNGLTRRPRDIQFNHVYSDSQNPDLYTCLANLCITPSFLSKLTDTNLEIKHLLRYRAWDLFGWHPSGTAIPNKPAGYAELIWAPCLPPVDDVRATFEAVAARRPKDRTVLFTASLGLLS